MKIGILQLDYLIGDCFGNTKKIIDGYNYLVSRGAELVVCSELAIFGYPPKDLLEFPEKIDQQLKAFDILCSNVGEVPIVIGVAERNFGVGKPLFNNAVVVRNGIVIARKSKELLPTYDVFDERRYFEPGPKKPCIFNHHGKRIGVVICEDAWGGTENPNGKNLYANNPIEDMLIANPDILVIPNGSPYFWGKVGVRLNLVSNIAQRLDCPVVYVNQVGGQDDIIFDGGSFIMSRQGTLKYSARLFEEHLLVADTDFSGSVQYDYEGSMVGQLYRALVMGTKDYLRKINSKKVVIGESGGIDSALTTCIAVDALGKENVTAIGMPSQFSSEGSLSDSQKLCDNLGAKFKIIPINRLYNLFGETVQPVIHWNEPKDFGKDVTEENVQARLRGMILMAYSNRTGAIVLSTGNKSELAVGYCTLYGDMCGGLAVISDVPKTLVFELARYINKSNGREIIPISIIEKPPSAELRPNQKDQDSLPPYNILDEILRLYVEECRNAKFIIEKGFDPEQVISVINKVNRVEFKRRQASLGLKVTTKAFGSGRRIPIAMKY